MTAWRLPVSQEPKPPTEASFLMSFPGEVPNMWLSSNGKVRLHRMARAELTRTERFRWRMLFLSPKLRFLKWTASNPPPYTLCWEVRFKDKRGRDDDGVLSALKHARDGLVDAGLLAGDGNAVIQESRIRVVLGSKDAGTTLIVRSVRTDPPLRSVPTDPVGTGSPSERTVGTGRLEL